MGHFALDPNMTDGDWEGARKLAAHDRAWKCSGCVAHDAEMSEGFVVRSFYRIPYTEFDQHVGKWVRPNHVQTAAAWRRSTNFPTNRIKVDVS